MHAGRSEPSLSAAGPAVVDPQKTVGDALALVVGRPFQVTGMVDAGAVEAADQCVRVAGVVDRRRRPNPPRGRRKGRPPGRGGRRDLRTENARRRQSSPGARGGGMEAPHTGGPRATPAPRRGSWRTW